MRVAESIISELTPVRPVAQQWPWGYVRHSATSDSVMESALQQGLCFVLDVEIMRLDVGFRYGDASEYTIVPVRPHGQQSIISLDHRRLPAQRTRTRTSKT